MQAIETNIDKMVMNIIKFASYRVRNEGLVNINALNVNKLHEDVQWKQKKVQARGS